MIQKKKESKTLLDLANDRSTAREKKNKKVFKDGVNQRADIKQDLAIENIVAIAGCDVEITKYDLCKKLLQFERLPLLKDLKISYYTRNNLFSRIFDFLAETSFATSSDADISVPMEIGLKYQGNLKTKGLTFIPLTRDDVTEKLAAQLNSVELLKDRVRYLQLLDYRIKYDPEAKKWYVGVATGKGSAVWMLFPPLVMLTPLSQQDAIKLIELFQLTIKEVSSFENHT